jgi:hypothetical protein
VILLEQSEINALANVKLRRRTFELPMRHGVYGELKRAPRIGSVHKLRAASSYVEMRTKAGLEPTRARAVTRLFDLCEPGRTLEITILDVTPLDGAWLVTFAHGDRAASFDNPRLLRAGSPIIDPKRETDEDHGYTSRRALALADEPEAISAKDLEHYTARARENEAQRVSVPWEVSRLVLRAEVEQLRLALEHGRPDRARHRALRNLERALQAMERLMAERAQIPSAA